MNLLINIIENLTSDEEWFKIAFLFLTLFICSFFTKRIKEVLFSTI